MTPMEEYLQFLTIQGEVPGSASYEKAKKLAETLGGVTPQYTGAKDYAPLEQFLTQQFGDIGGLTKFTPSDDASAGFGTLPGFYEAAPHLRYHYSMGFGGVPDRNNPIGITSLTPTGYRDPIYLADGADSEGTPTGYSAALTFPYERDGVRGQYVAQYDDKGQMIGKPQWVDVPHEDEGWGDFLLKSALMIGGAAFGAPMLGELLGGVGAGTTAATLGELGINTALAAGTPGGIAAGTIAGDALTTFNLGQTLLPDAPGFVQQGVNRFATGLVTSGGDPKAAALNVATGGLGDVGNIALSDIPASLRAPIINVATQVAQGKDLETAITNAAVGGLSSIGNTAFSEVPSAIRAPITNVVSQLAQGKPLEAAVKNAAAGSLSSIAGSGVKDFTDSKFVGDLASNAVRQLVSTGEVDPAKLSSTALNQLSNTIVDSIVGPPARQGGLNQTRSRSGSGSQFGSDLIKSAVTGALSSAFQPSRSDQVVTSRSAAPQTRTRAPIQVDVASLQPIVRQQSRPPPRVDVSTLTPISRATNLSAIVGNTGKSG